VHAVDTNVLIRFFVADEPGQTAAVTELFAAESIWIGNSVLLEAEWVLRSAYGFDKRAIIRALSVLLGYERVTLQDPVGLMNALALASEGVEIADALHVCSTPPGATFVTFDRKLAQRAARAGATNVSLIES
jgi:predicted nucleic-acid-binding protein